MVTNGTTSIAVLTNFNFREKHSVELSSSRTDDVFLPHLSTSGDFVEFTPVSIFFDGQIGAQH